MFGFDLESEGKTPWDKEEYIPDPWMGEEIIKRDAPVQKKKLWEKKFEELYEEDVKDLDDQSVKAKNKKNIRKSLKYTIPYASKLAIILSDPAVKYSITSAENLVEEEREWVQDKFYLKNSLGVNIHLYEMSKEQAHYFISLAENHFTDRICLPFGRRSGLFMYSNSLIDQFKFEYFLFKLNKLLHRKNIISKNYDILNVYFLIYYNEITGEIMTPKSEENGKFKFGVELFFELQNVENKEYQNKIIYDLKKPEFQPEIWRHVGYMPTEQDYDRVYNQVVEKMGNL